MKQEILKQLGNKLWHTGFILVLELLIFVKNVIFLNVKAVYLL